MGINPTPTNHRSFTFDGKSTREFGVYITGKDVFNAPERAVEMISIPGRDGEYALDQGHFNNIEVTYRAGIVADSTTDFAEAISNFRNWLASREGYCRLTDEYNTEEYRMAVFKNAIALEHEGLLTGEFDVTFDCKPQRYLAIGEELTEIGAWGNTETAEGAIVTIDASSDTAVKALTADIEPIQDLSHGDPSPENICPISGHDEVGVSVYGKNLLNSNSMTDGYISYDGTINASSGAPRYEKVSDYIPIESGRPYVFSCTIDNADEKWVGIGIYNANKAFIGRIGSTLGNSKNVVQALTSSQTSGAYYARISLRTYNNMTDAQFEEGTEPTEYEEYKYYTTTLPSTTYGGTLDVVSGTFKPAPYYASYNGEALEGEWVSDRDKYVAGTTPTTGAQVVNIGKVGTATQLTGQSVELLEGENNIFADSGNVTVEYGHNPTLLTNPTWFPSKPLLAVDGYGEIKLNDYNMRIQDVPVGDITLVGASSFFLDNGSNGGTTSFTIDESELNTGDKITVSIEKLCFDVIINAASGYNIENRYTSDMSDENEHFVSPTYSYYSGTKTVLKYTGNMSASISFDVGTSSTVSGELPSYIKVRKTSPSPLEIEDIWFRLYPTVSYNANIKKITISWYGQSSWQGVVGSLPTFLSSVEFRNTTNQSKLDSIKAYSTKSTLTDTIYVDCEIGECYTIRNGSVITLNDTVTLGSDLPTLPSGDTEVTYDNTITKVEVKPNWWKV